MGEGARRAGMGQEHRERSVDRRQHEKRYSSCSVFRCRDLYENLHRVACSEVTQGLLVSFQLRPLEAQDAGLTREPLRITLAQLVERALEGRDLAVQVDPLRGPRQCRTPGLRSPEDIHEVAGECSPEPILRLPDQLVLLLLVVQLELLAASGKMQRLFLPDPLLFGSEVYLPTGEAEGLHLPPIRSGWSVQVIVIHRHGI